MTLEGYAWSPAEVLRKAKTFHAYELYFWVAMEGEHYQMRRISDRIAKETGSIFAKWFNDRPRRSAELSDATVEALGSVATYPGWKATKTDGPDASFCTDPLAAIQKLLERPDQPHPVPPIELMHAVEWGKAARGEPAVNIFGIPVSVNPHLPADTIAAVDAAGKVHVVRNVGNGVPLSPSEAGQDGAGPVESRGGNEQALVQPSAGSPPNGGTA